jgi:hypothetical protein
VTVEQKGRMAGPRAPRRGSRSPTWADSGLGTLSFEDNWSERRDNWLRRAEKPPVRIRPTGPVPASHLRQLAPTPFSARFGSPVGQLVQIPLHTKVTWLRNGLSPILPQAHNGQLARSCRHSHNAAGSPPGTETSDPVSHDHGYKLASSRRPTGLITLPYPLVESLKGQLALQNFSIPDLLLPPVPPEVNCRPFPRPVGHSPKSRSDQLARSPAIALTPRVPLDPVVLLAPTPLFTA